jgi:hypothetical protein
MSNNFLVPLVLNHKSKALIYGEKGPSLIYSYQFEDVSGVISVIQMRDTFKYKDNGDNNEIILKYDTNSPNSIKMDDWHDLITNQILKTTNKYRNSYTIPSDGLLSAHVIQWISSTLFGHPLAQAPLTNEANIISDIAEGSGYSDNIKLGQQIYDALKDNIYSVNGSTDNSIVQSIYEQMVDYGRFNDKNGEASGVVDGTTEYSAPADTDNFISLPFKSGDKLSFLIKVECELENDTGDITETDDWKKSGLTQLTELFSNIEGVEIYGNNIKLIPQVWKFTFVAN